jgi:hypothetical protein
MFWKGMMIWRWRIILGLVVISMKMGGWVVIQWGIVRRGVDLAIIGVCMGL